MAVPPLAFLPEVAPLETSSKSLLEHTTHNGFPVVDDREASSPVSFLRSQLDVLLAAPPRGSSLARR